MRLQEVLKEREAEITVLEESLKESRDDNALMTSPLPPLPDVLEDAPKINGKSHADATLSPKTMYQFDHIRKTMENGNGQSYLDTGSDRNGTSVISETDESLDRLNELML